MTRHRSITETEPHKLLGLFKKQERRGTLETAKRTRSFASRVFRYGVATARAKTDPASLLLGAITAPRPKNLTAILDPKRVGELLRALDGYSGQPATRFALLLSPYVVVRPGELWSGIRYVKAAGCTTSLSRQPSTGGVAQNTMSGSTL